MRLDTETTICSIATGSVGAIRGAIRISGPASGAVIMEVFPQLADEIASAKRAAVLSAKAVLDDLGAVDVKVFYWPDKRSYTGQSAAELHLLGAPMVMEAMQAKVLSHGAVLAQPGEFTLRAFLAGRLDLTQCEAVLGVIHASTDRSLQTALTQLAGGLSQPLQRMRTQLVNLLADIEAGLDFVDEDIQFVTSTQIIERLSEARETIAATLDQMRDRSAQTRSLQVVVVGEPNAGKSSLINAVVGKDVSIVSSLAGTTRDYVRARMDLDGVPLEFVDTAGTEQVVGNTPRGLAQQISQEQIAAADLIWWCVPCSESIDESRFLKRSLFPKAGGPVWLIRTKSDLKLPAITAEEGRFLLEKSEWEISRCFEVSVHDPARIDQLKEAVSTWVRDQNEEQGNVVPMTAQRCRSALEGAIQSIDEAIVAAQHASGDEVIASEIRLSLDDIGIVAGTVYNDDILDALFSRFCIGK